jgi:hypothetical protein
VYESSQKLQLDTAKLILGRGDFAASLQRVVPASRRSTSAPGQPLSPVSAVLLDDLLSIAVTKVAEAFPIARMKSATFASSSDSLLFIGDRAAKCSNRSDEHDLWISCLTDVQEDSVKRTLIGDQLAALIPEDGHQDQLPSTNRIDYSSSLWNTASIVSHPRLLLVGEKEGMGQTEVGSALLHQLEQFPVYSIDIASLIADTAHYSPEQALVARILEACKAAPSVIYLPDISSWWRSASDSLRTALISMTTSTNRSLPLLWISTASLEDQQDSHVDGSGVLSDIRLRKLLQWFGGSNGDGSATMHFSYSYSRQPPLQLHVAGHNFDDIAMSPNAVVFRNPSIEARRSFFNLFFNQLSKLPSTLFAARKKMLLSRLQALEVAPEPVKDVESSAVPVDTSLEGVLSSLSKMTHTKRSLDGVSAAELEEDMNNLRELRLFFRATLTEMFKEKKLAPLQRQVDPELVPDYYDIIASPMDLDTMRLKVDEGLYPTYKSFLYDLQQIGFNAAEYNPLNEKDTRGRQIVHAARSLIDMVESHAFNFKKRLRYDIFRKCDAIYNEKGIIDESVDFADTAILAELLQKSSASKADIKKVRSTKPRENDRFYSEVLVRHKKLKEELGEEHPSFGKTDKTSDSVIDVTMFSSRLKSDKGKRDDASNDLNLRRSSRGKRDASELISLEDVEGLLHRKRKRTESSENVHSTDNGTPMNCDDNAQSSTDLPADPNGSLSTVTGAHDQDDEARDMNNLSEQKMPEALILEALKDDPVMLKLEVSMKLALAVNFRMFICRIEFTYYLQCLDETTQPI